MKFSLSKTIGVGLAAAALLAGCGGGGGGGGRKILMTGGAGDNGGIGGQVDISAYTGGNLELLRHGSVDTSFDLPKVLKPYLGTNPKTVSVSATWTTSDVLTGGSDTITGDDGSTEATGLWVKEGVTLTIYPNLNNDLCCGLYDEVELDFTDGVLIEGNIVIGTQDDSTPGDRAGTDTASFYLDYPENIVIGPKATISTTPTAAGASAGWIDIDANSTVVNQGKITANGTDGTSGGDGGYIELVSEYYAIYNTGDITNNGGAGSTGTGGSAGGIEIYNTNGDCDSCGGIFNSGKLTSNGGDGKTGGGDGGYVELYSDSDTNIGAIVSSGDIEMSGGNCTGTDCDGGDSGNYLEFYNYSGDMRLSGKVTAKGGNGAGTGNGGDSIYDYIDIESYIADTSIDTDPLGGNVLIALDINAVGGDGGASAGSTGGHGAYLYVYVDHGNIARPLDYSVKFLGYDLIDFSGGDGRTDGGDVWEQTDCCADTWGISNNTTEDYNGDNWIGHLINEVDITGKGGAGADGDGGSSDYFEIYNDYDTAGITPKESVFMKNSGKIILTGGDGKTDGGDGGELYMSDQFRTENTGAVTTSGGSCTGSANCSGGNSGEIDFYSDDVLANHADLIADGGTGTGTGKGGSFKKIYLQSRATTHSGKLSNKGGGASTTGNGAGGGYIEILSTNGSSKVSGSANVAAGANAAPNSNGQVYLDGLNLELDAAGNVNF